MRLRLRENYYYYYYLLNSALSLKLGIAKLIINRKKRHMLESIRNVRGTATFVPN